MNKYFIVVCLGFMAADAANSGYNYQPQNVRPFSNGNSQNIYSPQQAPPLAAFSHQSPQIIAPGPQYNQAQAATPPQYYVQPGPSQQTIISKDIYIHSAPEETEEIKNVLGGGEAAPNRKNYRIIFIKAPSHNIRFNTQLIKQSQALNEEKTVIYVLSKKPEIDSVQSEVGGGQVQQAPTKPEVYFIRYKTQDEANRAQQEIQAQYDALGGSTQISDEGVAPVTSVIGGGAAAGGSIGSSFGGGSFSNGNGNGNFLQSASSNQQRVIQPAFKNQFSLQGGQSGGFGIEAPTNKYLPPKRI